MSEAVARRYAAAMADVAMAKSSSQRVRADFESFVAAFYSAADLRNFLESPAVDIEVKQNVIKTLAARMRLDPNVANFIHLIVMHGRTELLREIDSALGEELNARMGIAQAEVTSARALSDAERRDLTAALERRTGKKIEARFSEDGSLLGGAVVRVGSTVYDGSVREKLNRLRERLEGD
ncbi:MAG TPA: ATP synthase F1 subunit delta [Candidatus Acidoferrales bacterium]|nr:ATP synthase F1 subunit delta [Candidatus Acidoferrales bacterium]